MLLSRSIHSHSHCTKILSCSATLFIILLATFLLPSLGGTKHNQASATTDTENTTVQALINSFISVTSSNDFVLDPSPQTFSSVSSTITVSTNCTGGYTLIMNAGGSDTALHNTLDSSVTIPSLTQNRTIATFDSNAWGYSMDNTTYKPIPTSASPYTIEDAGSMGTETHTVYVGAKPGYDSIAGSHENSLVFTATTIDPVPYSFTYDKDTEDTVTNMPSPNPQTGTTTAANITLSSSTPARTGYAFGGWCDGTITGNSTTSPSCSGTTYQPSASYFLPSGGVTTTLKAIWTINTYTIQYSCNEGTGSIPNQTKLYNQNLTLSDGTGCSRSGYNLDGWDTNSSATTPTYQKSGTYSANTGATLYAIWKSAAPTTMQSMTSAYCASMTENASLQLTDTRDNKLYWVTKLKDGNCWMTQNLDYDLSVSANKSLSPTTSDVSSNTTLTITSSWGSSYTALYYKAGAEQYLPNGSGTAANITCTSSSNGGNNCHYHIGDYYSWNAATANTHSSTTQYSNASGSICPKGWRLPKGFGGSSSVDGDFKILNNAYGGSTSSDSTLLASPLYFVRSGRVNDGSVYDVGSYGYYWSSTVINSGYAYYLYFSSSSVLPTGGSYRYLGQSIRCIAR